MALFKLTLLLLIAYPGYLRASHLDLTRGTMTLGGHAALKYKTPDLKTTWSWNYFNMSVDTNWGYFLADQTAFLVNVKMVGPFSTDVYDARRIELGLGGMYLLCTNSAFYPYFQLIGYTAYQTSGWSVGLRPSMGSLFALTETLALDFGVDAMFDFATPAASSVIFELGMGHLGIRGFF